MPIKLFRCPNKIPSPDKSAACHRAATPQAAHLFTDIGGNLPILSYRCEFVLVFLLGYLARFDSPKLNFSHGHLVGLNS